MLGDRAPVDHGLAMVFAGIFELADVEQAVSGRIKAGFTHQRRDLGFGDADRSIGHQARISKTGSPGQAQKVIPIERTTQAFAIEHRMATDAFGQTPINVDI